MKRLLKVGENVKSKGILQPGNAYHDKQQMELDLR